MTNYSNNKYDKKNLNERLKKNGQYNLESGESYFLTIFRHLKITILPKLLIRVSRKKTNSIDQARSCKSL